MDGAVTMAAMANRKKRLNKSLDRRTLLFLGVVVVVLIVIMAVR